MRFLSFKCIFQIAPILLAAFPQYTVAETPDFHGIPAPTVTIKDGRLRGKYVLTRDGRRVVAFLGIPFAKPPLGELRFEPPQPVEPWQHERLAIFHSKTCTQVIDQPSSEDCLYLNVFTPDIKFRPLLPVIVYIHGGGFEFGSSGRFDGNYLLDEDIVYVCLQYRLGLFGFLSTGDEVVPGNMGLKDMRMGLRWVRDNIRNFGGDPDKVTINGESSGATAVHNLMQFIADEGLFRAAISASGSGLDPFSFRPPIEIKRMVEVLAALSGCPQDHVGFVKCLKSKPAADLVVLYSVEYKNVIYGDTELIALETLPLIGAVVEPECVEDRIITGNPWYFNTSTPWLVSVNSKEALFFFLPYEVDLSSALFLSLNAVFDDFYVKFLNYQSSSANGSLVPAAVREFYLHNLPISQLTLSPFIDLVTDGFFYYGIYEALRRNRENSYFYYSQYIGLNELYPIPPYDRIGPSHADDLFYFFPHPDSNSIPHPVILPGEDYQLSKTLIKFWVNFATCLDPTPSSGCTVDFKPFLPNYTFLNITQTNMKVESPFLPDRMKFWQSQPFPFRDDIDYRVPCKPRTMNMTDGGYKSKDQDSSQCENYKNRRH